MVDRIGKGGGVPPPTGPSRTEETGKVFDVQRPGEAKPAQGVEQVGKVTSPALEQLKAGQIDFNQYVDIKVNEATQHLHGLTKVQLDNIRQMLRDRMATDPELVDLLQQATGRVPVPEE